MWAYVPATLPVQPVGGRLGADLTLRFEQPRDSEPRLDLKGRLELRDFNLKPPGDAPLLAWQSLRVQLGDVRPLQRRVVLDAVQLDGAVLHVRRDAAGRLQLEQLAAAAQSAGSAPAAAAAAGSAPASGPAAPAVAPAWHVQLALLELKDARVHWSDAALQPAADMQLDGIQLQLKQLQWPFETDASLLFDAQLQAQGKAHGSVHAEGQFTDRKAQVGVQLADIDLALAEPYLRQFLRPQASARLNASAALDWARGDAPRMAVGLSTLRIDDFRLADAQGNRRGARPAAALAQLARLELSDLQADLLQRRIDIGTLSLHKPFIDLARDAEGVLNASRWLVVAPSDAVTAPETDAAPPWQLTLRDFKLDGGRARLADVALPTDVIELAGVRVGAMGLAWPARAPLNTELSASLTVAGTATATGAAPSAASRLDWRGRISPQPWGASGKLRLERFPVHVFEPYFGAALPVLLRRLEAGFQGQLDLKLLPAGLSGQVRGEALLADLRVLAKPGAGGASAAAERELLTWNAVSIGDFGLSLQPDSKPLLEIGELRITDYYSRLEITEDGRFNLQTVAAPAGDANGRSACGRAPAPCRSVHRRPCSAACRSTWW